MLAWSTAMAIYAAALSTVLGAIRVWEFFRDRPDVRVSLCLRAGGPDDPRGRYFVTRVVNKGRRPATIDEIGIEYSSGTKLLASIFYPKDLRPPATLTESMQVEGFIPADPPFEVGEVVRRGYAKGSDGKLHTSAPYVQPES